MRFFPKIDFLRRRFYREAELAALDKDIAAAGAIADPGERLLRYADLRMQSLELSMAATENATLAGSLAVVGAIVAMVAGAVTANPGLAVVGSIALYGAMTAGRETGKNMEDAAEMRSEACKKSVAALIDGTEPQAFAPSPQFEDVMQRFPDLQKKFVLAAAREKLMPELPAAPAAKPQGLKL